MGSFIGTTIFFFLVFLFFVVVGSQIAMLMNRKPGITLVEATFGGKALAIQVFGRRYLTERGIFWRNVSWVALSILLTALIVGRFVNKYAPLTYRAE
jgi:hypothetical protein